MVTRTLAAELEAQGANILVNSVTPGWCKTDMGGPQAPRKASEGAEGIVWLATLPDGGPTGGFFRDKKPLGW
jgi:NAD(P)-dependent dehydrogenase (short-subunit alcohol dehydrogenase family)